jgi:hypothetical protein
MKRLFFTLITLGFFAHSVIAATPPPTVKIYDKHCADCHGADRLGRMGPALLPENLSRLKKKNAATVIANGLPATQMPAFSEELSKEQIQGLVDYIYTPLAEVPKWGMEEIKASQIINYTADQRSDTITYKADPLNLFIVVEIGDHHATVLDGDKLEPIYRFETRPALHGGPKYSPDGRFVYFASRDGWISKFDIYNLKVVAEIRAGINTRNLALSGDGRYVMVGNYLPHTLVALDATDLSPIKLIPVTDKEGKKSSRVSAVYQAAPRNSFVVALKDFKEVWEIPYYDKAKPPYTGLVHDYRKDSGEILPDDTERFPIYRTFLEDYLDDFFFDQEYRYVIGAARGGGKGQVVYLDGRRKIADIDISGMPHLGSGIIWDYQGRPILATPNLKEGSITFIDMKNWKTIKRIETMGPGFFMRSHEKSRYAWVDVFFGPNKDRMHIIDKETLEIVKTLRPSPGKTSAHIEFTRDGRYALMSIWEKKEDGGALVIYDAESLKEVKRIPMNKPSGKYNVYNKINRSMGTSH